MSSPKVVLTGANGFLASTILQTLVERGFSVIGTVRSLKKGADILAQNPSYGKSVKFVEVDDFTSEKQWEKVFIGENVDFVIHTATPIPDHSLSGEAAQFEVLRAPAVDGNLALLRTISKHGKTVKHLCITGSVAAVYSVVDVYTTGRNDKPITSDDWYPTTLEEAHASHIPMVHYSAAKKFSELAVWDYVEKEKPTFSVSVLLAPAIVGPTLQVVTSPVTLAPNGENMYNLFSGEKSEIVAPLLAGYIDTRDLAEVHINALTNPRTANRRFIFGAPHYSNNKAVEIISKNFPEIRDRLVKPGPNGEQEPLNINDKIAKEVFDGVYHRTFEETVVDSVKLMLQLEKKNAWKV